MKTLVLLAALALVVGCNDNNNTQDGGGGGGTAGGGGGGAGGGGGGSGGGGGGGVGGGGGGGTSDGGTDAGVDAGADAGSDAGSDGGADAGVDLDPLADAGSVQLIDAGFGFLESPLWSSDSGTLLFSDVPGNTIFSYRPDSGVFDVYRNPSNGANGLAFDPRGRLVVCEQAARVVTITLGDAGVVSLAERFDGGRLNSPNDLVVKSDGTIFFTDPPYGVAPNQRELPFQGVYQIAPDAGLTLLVQDMTSPNGIALSPDERTLYISDDRDDLFRIYSLRDDGGLSAPVTVSTRAVGGGQGGDGMVTDDFGNLYVATVAQGNTSAGVKVYRADGGYRGRLDVPQDVTNVAFGDADRRTLYITAGDGLYKVRLRIPGRPQ
jgi:gluconolactonase